MTPVQLEFDFGELPKPAQPAPPHFENPHNDNERLLNYQYEYRQGDENALNKMYLLGYTIALKYINKKAERNRFIASIPDDDKAEKAHNAITYIIARFCKYKDFQINESFTSYLYLRVQHELFYIRKVDKIVQFVDMSQLYKGVRHD